MIIPNDSPLRVIPSNLSSKQILLLDGLRHAAEMVDIAYLRLFDHIHRMVEPNHEPTNRDISAAMLDAWSIIDSSNRFRGMLSRLPGFQQDAWFKELIRLLEDVEEVRNGHQHQSERDYLSPLSEKGGQIWGWLSWAEFAHGQHTGRWYIMCPGSAADGDRFMVGPAASPSPLPNGRIKLSAFGREVYLGLIHRAVVGAVAEIARRLEEGLVRAVGGAETKARSTTDSVFEVGLEVLVRYEPEEEA